MSNNPKRPPDWVLEFIDRAWIIKPEEGLVLSRAKNRPIGGYLGNDVYVTINVTGYRPIRRGHVIWYGHYKDWPIMQIDHKDRVCNNDKINNLRLAPGNLNALNRSCVLSRSLPYGVYPHRGGYKIERQYKYLGWFKTVEEVNAFLGEQSL